MSLLTDAVYDVPGFCGGEHGRPVERCDCRDFASEAAAVGGLQYQNQGEK